MEIRQDSNLNQFNNLILIIYIHTWFFPCKSSTIFPKIFNFTLAPISYLSNIIFCEIKTIQGHDWASRQLISMHHLTPDEIRIYDNLLYRVKSPQLSQFYLT